MRDSIARRLANEVVELYGHIRKPIAEDEGAQVVTFMSRLELRNRIQNALEAYALYQGGTGYDPKEG